MAPILGLFGLQCLSARDCRACLRRAARVVLEMHSALLRAHDRGCGSNCSSTVDGFSAEPRRRRLRLWPFWKPCCGVLGWPWRLSAASGLGPARHVHESSSDRTDGWSVFGAWGDAQVGVVSASVGNSSAALWEGSASSFASLHPSNPAVTGSGAFAVFENEQGGGTRRRWPKSRGGLAWTLNRSLIFTLQGRLVQKHGDDESGKAAWRTVRRLEWEPSTRCHVVGQRAIHDHASTPARSTPPSSTACSAMNRSGTNGATPSRRLPRRPAGAGPRPA